MNLENKRSCAQTAIKTRETSNSLEIKRDTKPIELARHKT